MKKPIIKSLKEARRELTQLSHAAGIAGETVIINKSGKPLCKIVGLTKEDLKNLEGKDKF